MQYHNNMESAIYADHIITENQRKYPALNDISTWTCRVTRMTVRSLRAFRIHLSNTAAAVSTSTMLRGLSKR
jgi:hypothetical protein